MRSVTPMRAAKIGYIVMSALFCLLGIALLFTPDASALWLGRLLGIGMIVFGAVKLVGYFSRDLFRLAFQYDLAFGVLLMVLGIVTLSHPGDAMSFLCVMFGIPVLADGLFKIQIGPAGGGVRRGLPRRLAGAGAGGTDLRHRRGAGVPARCRRPGADGPDGPVAFMRRRAEPQRGAVYREDREPPAARRDRDRRL